MTIESEKQFGVELQKGTVATRVGLHQWYIRRVLTDFQIRQAAAPFSADASFLSSHKKLIDTKTPAWRKVTGLQRAAVAYWQAMTVPYPIKAVRLLNRDLIESFEERMSAFHADMEEALNDLQAEYDKMREHARTQLGDLYSASDYPDSIREEFDIAWDYPSVTPPEYLKQLNPALYERECQRVAARFDEAVQMAEAMFAAELADLVSTLVDRLQPAEEGKKRILKESLVTNLQDFLERFKHLNVGSNAQLDEVVKQCEQIVAGVDVKELRHSGETHAKVKEGLELVKASISAFVVDQPERAFAFDES